MAELPRGCVRAGCLASVVLIAAGLLFSLLGLAAASGDSELLGVDLRPLDVLGILDAVDHELALEGLEADGEGTLVRVAVVPGESSWTWTRLAVRGAELRGDGQVLPLTIREQPSLEAARPVVVLRLDRPAAALPGPWTLSLDLSLAAESWGGLNSFSSQRSSELTLSADQRR